MKWIVKNNNGILEFKSIVVCTDSQYNKINASINQQKICNWCDDMHVKACTEHNGNQPLSILVEAISEITESEARRIDRLHTDFLKFVDDLPEVDAEEDRKDLPKEEQSTEEIIKFANETLAKLHNEEISGAILVTSIGPINIPRGEISHKVLTQMFEAWLQKYGK